MSAEKGKEKVMVSIFCVTLLFSIFIPVFPLIGASVSVIHDIENLKLTNKIESCTRPSVAIDSNGNLHIVFRYSTNWIYYMKVDQSGNIKVAPKNISGNLSSADFPKLALDSMNNVHVVWSGKTNTGDNRTVFYTKLNSSGSTLIFPKVISQEHSFRPDISVDARDYIHVVWWYNHLRDEIYYEYMNNNGVTLGDDLQVSTSQMAKYPSISGGYDRRAYIVWEDTRDGNAEIYYSAFDMGARVVDETRLTVNSYVSTTPLVATDSLNYYRLHILWKDDRTSSNNLLYKKIDSGGAPIIDDIPIMEVDISPSNTDLPSLYIDGIGQIHIVVIDQFRRLLYMVADNQGDQLLSVAESISEISLPENDNVLSSVTATSTGDRVFIVWSDKPTGESNKQIYIERLSFTPGHGSVSGHVYDSSGSPVSNTTVVVKKAGTEIVVGQATSSSDGSYQVTDLPQANYDIRAEKLGYAPEVLYNVSVIADQDTSSVDFFLEYIANPGFISGTVYENGMISLQGAEVEAYQAGTSILIGSSTTDKSGHYQIGYLLEGVYDVIAWKYGYRESKQLGIPVFAGQNTAGIDFILNTTPGSISGIVTEIDGTTPIPDAEVIVAETEQKTVTDQHGEYLLEGVSPGTYTVKAKKELYRPTKISHVVVEPGKVTEHIDLSLERSVPPPGNLRVWQGESSGELYIRWDAVTKDTVGNPITVDYYNLYRSTDSGGPYTLITSTTETTYTNSNLMLGTRYYYVVTAFWQVMESFYSYEASRVPGVRNQPPEARIVATPTTGQAALKVQFDGSESTDSEDGTNLRYSWDFDSSDGIRNESCLVNPSHIYEKAGIYTVILTVIDKMGAKNVTTIEITVTEIPPPPSPPPEPPWSKEPSIYIDIPKDSYASDEYVEITVSGYMPGTGFLVVYEEVVDSETSLSYVEYRAFSPVALGFERVITIPALPVYNNEKHKVIAELFGFRDYFHPRTMDIKEYSVEYDICDMIIMTNPNALRSEFNIDNWGDSNPGPAFDNEGVLFLIQEATNDKGILFYTNRTSPQDIKNEIRDMIYETANDPNFSNIRYLFILGGNGVIPFEDFWCLEPPSPLPGVSDSIYWDLNGDLYPDLSYARLPTFSSSLSEPDNDILNYLVFKNVLKGPFHKKIDSSLIMAGKLDIADSLIEKAKDLIGKILFFIYNVAAKPVIKYKVENLQESGLLVFAGDGDVGEICTDGPLSPPLVFKDESIPSEYGVRFRNKDGTASDEDSYQILFNIRTNSYETYKIGSGDSNRIYLNNKGLNSPIVFSASCSNMDIVGDDPWSILTHEVRKPLAFHMMILGTKAFFGYGSLIRREVLPFEFGQFVEELCGLQDSASITVGEIFYKCAARGADEGKFNLFRGKFLPDFDLRGFMVFGYPKLQVTLDSSQPKSKVSASPSSTIQQAPDSICFSVENYNILPEDEMFRLSFSGVLNSDPIESVDWTLQGNPIVPYIYRVYDIPAGKTVDSLLFTSTQQNIGTYNLREMPGTHFGNLYEYYPLDYTTYMPEPVQWKIFKKADGNMVLVVNIFPFQYNINTKNVIMHDHINIDITYVNRMTSIISAATNNALYLSNESVMLTVESIGASELRVTVDGEDEIIEQSTGTNIFWIEISDLNLGFHTLEIKSYIGDSLMDEETIGFTITENIVDIGAPVVSQPIEKGADLQVLVPLMNRDTRPASINLKLNMSQENYAESINLGLITLEGEEMKWLSTTISTSKCEQGEMFLRVEGSSEYGFFRSPYGSTFLIAQPAQMQSAPEQNVGIYNELLRPLSWYNIEKAKSLLQKAYNLLEQAKEKGLDASECEKWLQEGEMLLGKAQEYYTAGNYVSANYYANEAIETIQRAIECLEGLLH
jgi:hypothetical protein